MQGKNLFIYYPIFYLTRNALQYKISIHKRRYFKKTTFWYTTIKYLSEYFQALMYTFNDLNLTFELPYFQYYYLF
jgi:hypothetical protein